VFRLCLTRGARNDADNALVKAHENLAIERNRTKEVEALLGSIDGYPDDTVIRRVVSLLYPSKLLRSF
jgi:hypothetical protein